MVAEAAAAAAEILKESGVESFRLDAEILLAHVLGCSRLQIIAYPEAELTGRQAAEFDSLVRRRAGRCPLAYLVGCREFYGMRISVREGVLVPRPETELLVEQVVARMRGRRALVADVGTGSGAVAVAVAASLPDAAVYATDISADALEVAGRNVANHHLADRVKLARGDLTEPLKCAGVRFDAVVSNPPYVPSGQIPSLEPEVSQWEPR